MKSDAITPISPALQLIKLTASARSASQMACLYYPQHFVLEKRLISSVQDAGFDLSDSQPDDLNMIFILYKESCHRDLFDSVPFVL